ncbi:hypothetical protein GCM10010359_28410 [Streptomyces morookaense]|uniref:GPP34 family phosphoprotein n=2 Tax=Streptomyces morookaense TaxID=1970 RepID=A0A7Y7B9H2_STRMO|nr:GPP34 family phosphoprotein [Streptomyces morookaense]GHF24457.1 hypothetical protein GCM10010359_28410 [Streptomyces morookaense]
MRSSARVAFGCAATELGELAPRRRIRAQPRNSKVPVRADELPTEPPRDSASGQQSMSLHRWLRQHRRAALSRHRRDLVHRGILRHAPNTPRAMFTGRSAVAVRCVSGQPEEATAIGRYEAARPRQEWSAQTEGGASLANSPYFLER